MCLGSYGQVVASTLGSLLHASFNMYSIILLGIFLHELVFIPLADVSK